MKFTGEQGHYFSNLLHLSPTPNPSPCYCCPLVLVIFLAFLGDNLSTVHAGQSRGRGCHLPQGTAKQDLKFSDPTGKEGGVSSLGFTMGPQSNDRCLIKGNLAAETRRRHREEFHVMTEAEIGAMLLQVKEHQRPSSQQKPGERTGTYSPLEPPEGTNAANNSTSDFQTPEL